MSSRLPEPMPGGPMPGGGMPEGMPQGDPIRENFSLANPADLALAQKDFQGKPVPSIREFLESRGYDVEGPVTQLVQKTLQDKSMLGKAKNIAGQGAPPPPPGGAPQPPSMNTLLQGV